MADAVLVAFDLDGTLIDSKRDLAESTNAMLATFGAAPLAIDAVAMMVGEGARVLVRRALAAAGLDVDESNAFERFRTIYDAHLLNHTRPYDGITDVVAETARSAVAALLTNKPEAPSRRLLDAFDFSRHMRWVVGGDSGFARKPDPAGLRHLMAVAGATSSRTLLVGDSIVDVETAQQAGAAICLARYGFGQARGEAGLRDVASFGDTPAQVGREIARFIARVE